jgi:hypothetical protein
MGSYPDFSSRGCPHRGCYHPPDPNLRQFWNMLEIICMSRHCLPCSLDIDWRNPVPPFRTPDSNRHKLPGRLGCPVLTAKGCKGHSLTRFFRSVCRCLFPYEGHHSWPSCELRCPAFWPHRNPKISPEPVGYLDSPLVRCYSMFLRGESALVVERADRRVPPFSAVRLCGPSHDERSRSSNESSIDPSLHAYGRYPISPTFRGSGLRKKKRHS